MQRHPGATLARMLMAGMFVVLGAWRLYWAYRGTPTPGSVLTFSTIELALGLLLASGWKLRVVALVAALLMLADAALSHPFWSLSGAARDAQLLHFMKNVGLVGGFVLLAVTAGHERRRR